MEEPPNGAPSSSKEPEVLDMKPLRTLSPMFPVPLGLNTLTASTAPPLVYITPMGPFASGFMSGYCPSCSMPFHTCAAPEAPDLQRVNPIHENGSNIHENTSNGTMHEGLDANGSMHVASSSSPVRMPSNIPLNRHEEPPSAEASVNCDMKVEHAVPLSSYGVGISKLDATCVRKPKRKRPKKIYDQEDMMLLPCSSYDARESVEVVLMTFDALRRRLLQMDEARDMNNRPVVKAGTIMMDNDLRVNKTKRIGHVPGVEVGDLFYFRIEMCLIGLHAHTIGGIDYMTVKFDQEEDPVAICIVSAGGYENDEDDIDVLIYSGQGGSSKNDKKDDQKLERGNLALERSLCRGNEIRVVRSAKDFSSQSGKVYIYDGLYRLQESWVEMGKSGFNVFKYKLFRQPGQPEGIAIWKKTEKWKENPSSRSKVILPDMSSGIEKLPVCLVNDVDDEKGPSYFTYSTKVIYLSPATLMNPVHGCTCRGMCLAGDANCSCAQQNGGNLPYSSNGLLVSHRPLIYECSAFCQCSVNCRNRVTQKGVKLHFEVFRTSNRGWGLRSWDAIRAGTFICEYTGEITHEIKVDEHGEQDDYIFQALNPDEKALNWNYGPELLGEQGCFDLNYSFKPLPIIISAKNMGNMSRFMNHSCSPNVFWQAVQHDHGDERYPHILFFALKHIPPMTELTYNYGTRGAKVDKEDFRSSNESHISKTCLCGSPKCQGYFG